MRNKSFATMVLSAATLPWLLSVWTVITSLDGCSSFSWTTTSTPTTAPAPTPYSSTGSSSYPLSSSWAMKAKAAPAPPSLSYSRQNNNNYKPYNVNSYDSVSVDSRRQKRSSPSSRHYHHNLYSLVLAMMLSVSTLMLQPGMSMAATTTTDPKAIVGCLVQKCPVPLLQCIANPKCLLNVACINTCNGKADEIGCQIQCGNLFENNVVGVFNKCAVSDRACVPQKPDDGSYPIPKASNLVSQFPTASVFTGRWYITAGQNPLFDTFPCQVHFFSPTGPNKFVGKLNWRVEEPDGEFFTRDALQAFVQDPDQPGHLLNHDNEYLHYQDDWYIIDYEPDSDSSSSTLTSSSTTATATAATKSTPTSPFVFVYYRGSNDAWDGYGGAVVYTRAATLPRELLPRLRIAAHKVGFDFDRDFTWTDNTCPTTALSAGEKVLLREKFAGKILLQTQEQLQAQSVRIRGNVVNSVKAQKLFFDNDVPNVQKAFDALEDKIREFEAETVNKK